MGLWPNVDGASDTEHSRSSRQQSKRFVDFNETVLPPICSGFAVGGGQTSRDGQMAKAFRAFTTSLSVRFIPDRSWPRPSIAFNFCSLKLCTANIEWRIIHPTIARAPFPSVQGSIEGWVGDLANWPTSEPAQAEPDEQCRVCRAFAHLLQ